MVAPNHLLSYTLVPPMGVGASFLLPSLVLSLVCLIGLLVLMSGASYDARCRAVPVLFFVLSLSVVLAALTAWSTLI